jgi:signal transduction histidine kinase
LFSFADLLSLRRQHVVFAPSAFSALIVLLIAFRCVPLLWFRRSPGRAFAGVLIGNLLTAIVFAPIDDGGLWPWSWSSQLSVLATLAAAGLAAGRRRAVEMATGYIMLTLLLLAVRPTGGYFYKVPFVIGESVLAVLCLELFRDRRDARQALARQEERTDAERTRRTLLEERARIGRELHDVVAHHMSLIAVQAETAPYRIPGQADDTAEEFRSISAASREALTDMRKILGLLRADSAEAEKAPQPRLADVPALVAEAGAGLEVSGDLEGVLPLIGVTAYRVVQESLSNARRHAQGAEVAVRIARTDEEVRVEVRNGPAPKAAAGDGHGIAGMRERVELVQGEFEAGPTPEGGFAVVVSLPLDREP